MPCYLYAQDLWPDNLEVVGGIHSKAVLNHYGKMANRLYNRYDVIYATSPSFVEEIKKRVIGDKEKVVYLPQYAEDFYKPLDKTSVEGIPEGKFKVVFTGNLGRAQGLDVLPKSAKILKERGFNDVLFVMVGNGRHKDDLLKEIDSTDTAEMFY